MKAAHPWRDIPSRSPQRNRFNIFLDPENDAFKTSPNRPQDARGQYKKPDISLAPQIAKGHQKGSGDISKPSRRNSFPTALGKSDKVGVPRTPGHDITTTRPRSSQVVEASGPRVLERPQTVERSKAPTTPFSLWDYLQVELAATDSDEAHDFKRERVKNFLILPDALERTLMFGFIVCLDSFMYIFTILPIRFVRSSFSLLRRSIKAHSSLQSSEKVDILKGILIVLTCVVLNQLDASRVYHNIRGQAAIKLYVLYNVLEIGDKLFCALGQDILDCLFSKSTFGRKEDGSRRHLRPLAFLILAVTYNVLHTILLFYQLVTLNVTVNSFSNALMTLLLSNQFVEIKGSVFKKFEKEGLFQITCADMVERFQLFLMLFIIGLRNTFEMAPHSVTEVLTTTLGPMATVLGSEVLVDWLKHAFITKFNHVRPTIYSRFTDVLCRDYVKSAGTGGNTFVDQSPAISRRIGLPVLPLVCLTIRSAGQIFMMVLDKADDDGRSWTDYASFDTGSLESNIIAVFCYFIITSLIFSTLIIIKLSLGVSLIRFAHGRVADMQRREDQEQTLEAERKRKDVYKGLVEVDGDTKKMLNNVVDNLTGVDKSRGLAGLERYSMVSKRIY